MLSALALSITCAPIACAETVDAHDPWRSFIAEAASRFGVSERMIRAVMHAESGGDTGVDRRLVTSSAGAMGLMQVMPSTYIELRDRYRLGSDPYDAHDNILAGAAYLREMRDRFGDGLFLAAYQAGPRRVEEFLASGVPLPGETLVYVEAVQSSLASSSRGGRSIPTTSAQPPATLFVDLDAAPSRRKPPPSAIEAAAIFVTLSHADRREVGAGITRNSSSPMHGP